MKLLPGNVLSRTTGDTMKITGILVLFAMTSLAGVFSEERICGAQPLITKYWKYEFERESRILNGEDSRVGEWPWQVMLNKVQKNNTKVSRLLCGGVLITPTYVLTAAHCIPESHFRVRVVLGAHHLNDTEEPQRVVRDVLRTIIHEEHSDSRKVHDIQIIVMDKPVQLTDYIRPICFPKPDENFSNMTVWVTGWGRTEKHAEASILQKVALPIWDYARCDAWLTNNSGIIQAEADGQFCTGYDKGGKDSCQGDSGGPVVLQRQDGHWTLVGIVSGGKGCGKFLIPGINTRVTHYRNWIEKQIKTKMYDD